ncbi:MAG: helix-turn-helix transcriptional regulator [Microbacterium sp.]
MAEDIDTLFARFLDAIARHDIDAAGRLLTGHLGSFALRDLDALWSAVAGLDIRSAAVYPAIAVFHPRQHELARLFPGRTPLPPLSTSPAGLGTADALPMSSVYAMAFAREAGRIRLARQYAEQIVAGTFYRAQTRIASPGEEWLLWFQLGKTSLTAGDLQLADRDFMSALGSVSASATLARVTQAYLALVAALRGDTTRARHFLELAAADSDRVGGHLWSLLATARALAEVEECAPTCGEAISALDRIEEQAPLWTYILLARTRYDELVSRPADSFGRIEAAALLYSPEIGSYAYDVLIGRRIESLILLARLNAARTVYEECAIDAPHCRLAGLALLFSEHDFAALDREIAAVLALRNLTPAQRVQADAFVALGAYVRSNGVSEYSASGLGRALSLRCHRRVALMFPPQLRAALEPYLSAELDDAWQHNTAKTTLWERRPGETAGSLTPRQLAMLRHLAQGRSYAQIAAAEHVTMNTVKTHMKLVFKKLGAQSSSEAIQTARRWGLLDSTG